MTKLQENIAVTFIFEKVFVFADVGMFHCAMDLNLCLKLGTKERIGHVSTSEQHVYITVYLGNSRFIQSSQQPNIYPFQWN